MLRRDFGKTALGALAASALLKPQVAEAASCSDFPKASGVTQCVATFVATTGYETIPADVIELGKKSILDGLGLGIRLQNRRIDLSTPLSGWISFHGNLRTIRLGSRLRQASSV